MTDDVEGDVLGHQVENFRQIPGSGRLVPVGDQLANRLFIALHIFIKTQSGRVIKTGTLATGVMNRAASRSSVSCEIRPPARPFNASDYGDEAYAYGDLHCN